MLNGMLGKKIGMTQIFTKDGEVISVTVIKTGPCFVVQKKNKTKDGYNSIQIGFLEKKKERVNKPLIGHFAKAKTPCFYHLKEFKGETPDSYQAGQKITCETIFKAGEFVDVSGVTKGRGFTGVMKRWNFAGGPGSHGSMFNRAPGSIGSSSDPSRVYKGMRMAGHYGNERVTTQNLKIIAVRPEDDIVLVKGGVPGHVNSILEIRKAKKKATIANGKL
ncbi:MAG: 50S ribosomal protein L3 [Deltaproteobacteria bacterium]|nr:50S ribosomal protein L3 [Deltaproteobacteria bacterium]